MRVDDDIDIVRAPAYVFFQRSFEPLFGRLLAWTDEVGHPGRVMNTRIIDDLLRSTHNCRRPHGDLYLLAEVAAVDLRGAIDGEPARQHRDNLQGVQGRLRC
jgi:hypothetical protein